MSLKIRASIKALEEANTDINDEVVDTKYFKGNKNSRTEISKEEFTTGWTYPLKNYDQFSA